MDDGDERASRIPLILLEYQVKGLKRDVSALEVDVRKLPHLLELKLEEHSERAEAKRRWSSERIISILGILAAVAIAVWKH